MSDADLALSVEGSKCVNSTSARESHTTEKTPDGQLKTETISTREPFSLSDGLLSSNALPQLHHKLQQSLSRSKAKRANRILNRSRHFRPLDSAVAEMEAVDLQQTEEKQVQLFTDEGVGAETVGVILGQTASMEQQTELSDSVCGGPTPEFLQLVQSLAHGQQREMDLVLQAWHRLHHSQASQQTKDR